ncbi:helix-turn-helix domain-containing protein [Streptomyces sp. XM4011]|uniref:helix-turn-helix domain-containing protein n=1 Tax=Streptomyces TaxID=1883 RepID=UPI001FF79A0E|nr:helix-turn-helix transcriptional regulator [Streptomyces sp. XM4011]MCK1817159.1 helix-turn-helix domain-containing protein [Streptomyces sp. XM4011]
MPPRDLPSAREARLGAELRKLRERAGKAAHEAATWIGTDRAKMSNIESGRRGISETRIRRLTEFYGCEDQRLIGELCAMAREHRGGNWWDAFRGRVPQGNVDMAELEHHATRLRMVHMLLVPGVFQTPGYARAVMGGSVPPPDEELLAARVALRIRRGELLRGEDPPPCQAIIHEGALRMRYGGRRTAREQLERLLDVAHWPSVELRVIPFSREDIPGHGQSFLYAYGPVTELDTVEVDTPFGGDFLHDASELEKYRKLLEVSERIALDVVESRQLIRFIAREM